MKKSILIVSLILFSQFLFAKNMKQILDDEYIVVGVEFQYKPFAYIGDEGTLIGFDIDILNELMDRLNVNVKYLEVTSRNKEKNLINDKVDLLGSSMIEKGNQNKDLIFTNPYFKDKQVYLINKSKKIEDIENLKDKKIGSIKNSIQLNNFLEEHKQSNPIVFSAYPQLTRALSFKNIDAITADCSWAKAQAKDNKDFEVIEDEVICHNSYSFALKKGNEKLRDRINTLIDEIKEDKTYDYIYKKWFD